jgi:hypothetical protein
VKLFLKNENIFVAKNDCEIQVRTILVCTLYSIKYSIVSNPLSEEQCLLQSVYSMMPVIQINFFLYKMEADKTEWGIGRREGEREREKQIKGVGGRA